MSTFIFPCKHCNHEITAQEEWIGASINCPACGKKNIVGVSQAEEQASAVTISCKQCGNGISVPAESRGTFVVCPSCGKKNFVGLRQSSETNANERETPRNSGFIFICPECGSGAELPESQKNTMVTCEYCGESVIATPATMRICPACGAKNKLEATLCSTCHHRMGPLIPAKEATGDGTPPVASALGISHSSPKELASLFARFAALVVDIIIISLACFAVNLAIILAIKYIRNYGSIDEIPWSLIRPIEIGTGCGIFFLYNSTDSTFGQRMMHIHVECELPMGQMATSWLSLMRRRAVCKWASLTLMGIGLLFAIFNRNRKTLHDIICHTRVVKD